MSSSKKRTLPERTALRRTLHVLRPELRGHGGLVALGMLAMFADVALRVLEPWPVKYAVDTVSRALGARVGGGSGLGDSPVRTLVLAAVALAVILGGRALANYASTIAFAKVGARVSTTLRARVFHHVQGLSLRYHARASVGDTSQRLVGDIGRLQEVAVTAGLPLVGNVITFVALAVIVVIVDPLLAGVVLVASLLYLGLSSLTTPRITKASRRTRQGEGRLVGSAAEALGAIRVVQAYGLEEEVAKDFAAGNARAMKAGVRARRLAARLERSTDVLIALAQTVVLLGGGLQVLRGQLTPGDLVLFLSYLKIAMKPLKDLAKYTGRISRAAASGERIADLLDEEPDIVDPPSPAALDPRDGTIELHGIRSRDGHGRELFTGLDLVVPQGQRIGLLGRSGSGKTTLVSYLLRLSEPEAGSVRVGGHEVREVRLKDLREHIAAVLQESVLFSDTVRENVRLGRPTASDADVEEAMRRAGAHEFVMAMPDGYDTVLGQRGENLSGGQRQRLAIARALVRNSAIAVFDEPTAGLDPVSKAQVVDAVDALSAGRTTVTITHDPAALSRLDRVVWLEDGRIVEDGDPRVLAADPDTRFARWLADDSGSADGAERIVPISGADLGGADLGGADQPGADRAREAVR